MSEWFKDWFDTTYYHILYKNRDYNEAERFIRNLLQHLDLPKDSKVLDLACGKGRHAIFLNKLGMDVLGVDLSASSIEEANKMSKNGLQFQRHDMREPLQQRFDAIFNLFTSFGYFDNEDENQRVMNAAANNLKVKGSIVIDFLNAHVVRKELVKKEERVVDGITFCIQKEILNNVIVKSISFTDKGKSYQYEEKVRLFELKDFERMAQRANLSITVVFGDYNLANFDAAQSERLIMQLKKK